MTKRSTRYLLLILMTIIAIGCCSLVPKIHINEDMTEYLPSDSHMREGLDTMKCHFPQIDLNAYYVKAMFRNAGDKDSLGRELCNVPGIAGITAISEKDGYTLYQLSVDDGTNPKAPAQTISDKYADSVIVETNANSNMPDNMVSILVIGSCIVFGILFLMCSSFVEALLFILTIGLAVAINMGTNSFLPSVSMMTNTIVAVLQLVLSMDYSIILMNRYRQVLQTESNIDIAMSEALKAASPSILSSSFTTIVGLLALVFMKFKIGLDLGLVLAKGVLCSLISIYTILPAFILIFDKAIRKTEKKVPLLHTDGIAAFEIKFRIPLAIVFLTILAGSYFLSQKTKLSYASIWESRINEVFHPQNIFSLLYKTEKENEVIGIADSLSHKDKVLTFLSYPSIMLEQHTVADMLESIENLAGLLPDKPEALSDTTLLSESTLRIIYYASSHPQRNEKMSFSDIMKIADDASSKGLIPEGMLPEGMSAEGLLSEGIGMKKMTVSPQAEIKEEIPVPIKEESVKTDSTEIEVVSENIDTQAVANEEQPKRLSLKALAEEGGSDVPDNFTEKYHFTRENINTQLTSVELASFLGFSRGQASTLYSMAGKKGKSATMSAKEFINYMTQTVLKNKFLRKLINDKQADGLYIIEAQMDSVMRAPIAKTEIFEAEIEQRIPKEEIASSEVKAVEPENNAGQLLADDADTAEAISAKAENAVDEDEINPMGALAEFALSGRKVSSGELSRMLHNAGFDISRNMVDLLFLYFGSISEFDESQTMNIKELMDFLCEEVALSELYSPFIADETRSALSGMKDMMAEGMGSLRTDKWSMAAIVTDHEHESEDVFKFVCEASETSRSALGDDFYLIGESVMYKEMEDGFRHELVILTLITIISIFLIVAITFKSILIPLILVLTVMCGVYVNVFVSGLGNRTMLYLAYLIVQSILMGAIIDYGILFTNYYLEKRRKGLIAADALKEAYRGSIHTIMTSGLIIICAPYIMSLLLPDPAISAILSSLTFGALAAILLILFVLPATLASVDKIITRKFKS